MDDGENFNPVLPDPVGNNKGCSDYYQLLCSYHPAATAQIGVRRQCLNSLGNFFEDTLGPFGIIGGDVIPDLVQIL